MIYNSLEIAKDDFRWFVTKSQISSSLSFRLSKNEIFQMEQKIILFDDKNILAFYLSVLDTLGYDKLKVNDELNQEMLPTLAFSHEKGVRIIFERVENKFKIQSKNGIEYVDDFENGTLFISLHHQKVRMRKQSAKKMFKDVAFEQKKYILYAAMATFCINILALGTSLYSMQVYDRVVSTGGISTLITLSFGVSIAILLEMILKIAKSIILDYATKGMDIKYSNDIFSRFLSIRCDKLPKSVGTLSGQLQSYGNVRQFISTAALYLLIDFPFSWIFLAVIIMLGGMKMGMVVVIFFFISLFVGLGFKKRIEIVSKASSVASYKKMGMLVETIENSENIKASGAKWNYLNKWNSLTHSAIDDDIVMRHQTELSSYLAAFFQQLSYISLVALGAYLVSATGEITMGALIGITILSGRILAPIAQLPSLFVQLGKAKLSVYDLDKMYALEVDNEDVENALYPHFINYNLQCSEIKFSYDGQMNALTLPSLTINQGEKVAILGAIGSGKSTLLKLLAGLYKSKEGNVHLGGIDMQHLSRDSISDNLAYLQQSSRLVSGTLRDNLSFGMIDATDEMIVDASKETGFINILNTLPKGLDTVINEGGEDFSGGQKQLIALTKVFLANRKIWLLDEPTASMDDGTEMKIISMLKNKLQKDQTLVVVTHKPIVLNAVDRIIVITNKGIVMDGDKATVMQKLSQPRVQNAMKENENQEQV
jgi:ATP-binding cassette subfamily C protein LapB